MSHGRFIIMRNDVFVLRHRTVHVDFYVHARGTSTTATHSPPRLRVAVVVSSSPAIIHHESATASRPMPTTSDVYVALLLTQPPAEDEPDAMPGKIEGPADASVRISRR